MYGTTPRLWPGSTIVCLASGPSLTPEDVAYCRGKARVIAIKDNIRLAPWADVLYGAGGDGIGRWWQRNGPTLEAFDGLRFSLDPAAAAWSTVLRNTGYTGIELDPSGLRTGKNSGYQAINLAVHLGARTIVLLGYDMQEGSKGQQRWFGAHPWGTMPWNELGRMMTPIFDTMIDPLRRLGVRVINASRATAIGCFERMPIDRALEVSVAA